MSLKFILIKGTASSKKHKMLRENGFVIKKNIFINKGNKNNVINGVQHKNLQQIPNIRDTKA